MRSGRPVKISYRDCELIRNIYCVLSGRRDFGLVKLLAKEFNVSVSSVSAIIHNKVRVNKDNKA